MAGETPFDMLNLGSNPGPNARSRAGDKHPRAALSDLAGDPAAPCSFDRPVRLRVTCMHLRHKLMYADERHMQRGMVDVNSDTRVFLCARTQEVLGPDDQPVGPAECSHGRACYCHGG